MRGILIALCGVAFACAATSGKNRDEEGSSLSTGSGDEATTLNPSSGSSTTPCTNAPQDDQDQDGFTGAAGDCNDCDANANPDAVEVTGDGADENCNGAIDEPPAPCDASIAIGDTDPLQAAAAIDLCQPSDGNRWGVVSASYLRAGGQPAPPGLQTGILDGFGPNVQPRLGARMLALSSGHARSAQQPNPCGFLTCVMSGPGAPPPGFPQDVPNCPGAPNINDDVALEVVLRAPSNATGYSFDFTFYTFEYPEWVCSDYNDQFIALIDPAPAGSIQGNISFDSQTNPVSVNIAHFDVCPGCAQGTTQLEGTGFGQWNDAGATGWLVTTAPVGGGETFTMRLVIWDTGDQALDSTVLIDNFQWLADSGSVSVGTQPVPK